MPGGRYKTPDKLALGLKGGRLGDNVNQVCSGTRTRSLHVGGFDRIFKNVL